MLQGPAPRGTAIANLLPAPNLLSVVFLVWEGSSGNPLYGT